MQRILIITKFRFIGDTLLAIPVFRAVRRQWPESHITLLTGRNARLLLQNNTELNEIIEFDPRGKNRGLRAFLRLVVRLRRARFDLCLILNRSFHSALIPALAGAKVRAGFCSEGRGSLLNRSVEYDHDKSEIDCYFDVLRAVAPQIPTDLRLELWLTEQECQEARKRLQTAFGEDLPSSRLIGIQPGASLPEKRWEAARFAEVANSLLDDDAAARLVVIGGPDEKAASAAMLASCDAFLRERIADFVGQADLRGSLALVSRMGLFIGNDTAILHSANALGVPTVALFGPTNPRKWGVKDERHRILQSDDGLMASIAVQDVVRAARELN